VILQTPRLIVRDLTLADSSFVLELLNEPSFLEFIGDKGIRDIAGAEKYLRDGPLAMYAQHGFGLWLVALKDGGTPIGSCGLLKRDYLNHPDIGYAYLARFTGQGYAHEAAVAVLCHAREHLKISTLHALTAQENTASIKLLGKLGFAFEQFIDQPGYTEPSRLFTLSC
jgi:[ribosomal protein S5]-alanine N-acetyltransferase